MKNQIILYLLLVNLSGCIGFEFTKNGDVVSTDFSGLSSRSHTLAKAADKINSDGSETYVDMHETKWCGLTIWAIIPIPLWLPLCQWHIEDTYKDGKLINRSSQWPATSAFLCGPFVPLTGGGGSFNFCTAYIH